MKRKRISARHPALALQTTPATAPSAGPAGDAVSVLLAMPEMLFLGSFVEGLRGG